MFTIQPPIRGASLELGAHVQPGGVYFGVYSRHARSVSVALFQDGLEEPVQVLPLPLCQGHVFQGFIPGLKAGALYGLIAEGPFDPRNGNRFNSRKLLLDPYAFALHGSFRNEKSILCGHVPGGEDADLVPDHRVNHACMPKCVVVESRFDWQGVRSPGHSRENLSLYEVHVKGFTAHPSAGVSAPGTFLGLVEKIPHLKSLGINAVELLPVHAKHSEDHLLKNGLSNYWGYNSAAFFALEPGYGSRTRPGCEVDEFKQMVRELHRAGIEVILDVVYNHTAEGSELGPTLSLRGLDNRSYYALSGDPNAPLRRYWNHTGCGNTLDFGSPAALRLVLDSLRHFVQEYHIDGFRFDLATVHGRRRGGPFEPDAPFFMAAMQDPILRGVKMIAEPWDMEAYGLGCFPDGWMEWNGAFRDTVRRIVRGDAGQMGSLRQLLEGSPDVFGPSGRAPWAGVNFVTCHDGFTLRDLVSYNHKHNQENGEENWDGSNDNHSWNCGEEGVASKPETESLRERQARNLLLLTALSRGTLMVSGGDEFLRSQSGNNNAYCQDNPVSWHNWNLTPAQSGFFRFFRELLAWRNRLGLQNGFTDPSEREWGRCWQPYSLSGHPLAEGHSQEGRQAAFLLRTRGLKGAAVDRLVPDGGGHLVYLLVNLGEMGRLFLLAPLPPPWRWAVIADTALAPPEDIAEVRGGFSLPLGLRYETAARSLVLLRAVHSPSAPN